tara:strand:+ start:278 stop:457 length:180 start_codon:yes stop_codon:yes gene_type:complete
LTKNFVTEAINEIVGWENIIPMIENPKNKPIKHEKRTITKKHTDLFQKLWVKYSSDDYS